MAVVGGCWQCACRLTWPQPGDTIIAMERAGFLSALQRAGWLLLAALWAGMALAQPAQPAQSAKPSQPAKPAQPDPLVRPKIVVQALSAGGFDVAAWSPDSRFVFTASGERRELLVWDMQSGVIVDRLRLPSTGTSAAEFLLLQKMVLQADQQTLRIEGDVLPAGDNKRVYLMDINKRRITVARSSPSALGKTTPSSVLEGIQYGMARLIDGLGKAEGVKLADRLPADRKRVLPPLPRSPDGRWGLERAGDGFALVDSGGMRVEMPDRPRLTSIADADLSPDERRLAILTMAGNRLNDTSKTTPIDVIDITGGEILPHVDLPGRYDRLRWLDADHYAALPIDRDLLGEMFAKEWGKGISAAATLPVSIVRAATGAITSQPPARCHMMVVPGNGINGASLVGAGLASCQEGAPSGPALERLVDGAWAALPGFSLPAGATVWNMAASPRGDRLAVVIKGADDSQNLRILDAATGAPGATLALRVGSVVMGLNFSQDGKRIWLATGNTEPDEDMKVIEWQPDAPPGPDGKPVLRNFPVETFVSPRFASRGNRLLIGGGSQERIRQIDLTTGTVLPDINFAGSAALGYMRSRPIMWAAGTNDGVRLWDYRSGQVLMTINLLPGQRQVVVADDGRYDTNMGPDSESFRWLFSDRPFQSLAPQTLMRDYYEPQLIRKLMDCTAANNCARVLKPVPPIAGLNRQLPEVRITGVTATEPGWAEVRVAATDTTDPVNGRKSGVFGIKLLMNNREVARAIDQASALQIMQGDAGTLASPGRDPADLRDWSFKVQLPSDGRPLEFAAYGFNSDRVKSDTVRLAWTPPPSPRRDRRAFVLTIGVNDYTERRLTLNFAVPDAELIAGRLVNITGYVTRQARLTTAQLPNGGVRQVTSNDINMALSILAGLGGRAARDGLREAGHDVDALDETTPDDIVIISFSGHGHADAAGNFALLASNVRWGALDVAPDPATTISADWLTAWLRYIRAGEIAFIIDACHSGAAVNTPDFKPGPMGDPGLGQLAFDKGIRILAATQADDVALENPNLAHGLLSAALGEGLTPTGGPADMDHDGKIPLDEWLRYAVARLPSLHEEVRRGGGPVIARGVRLVLRGSNEPPPVQEPSLFDFTNKSSPVLLRGQP